MYVPDLQYNNKLVARHLYEGMQALGLTSSHWHLRSQQRAGIQGDSTQGSAIPPGLIYHHGRVLRGVHGRPRAYLSHACMRTCLQLCSFVAFGAMLPDHG